MGVTEGVEFKDVRTMHILEPPADYRKLEQMFGRVIRRGSHTGLTCTERDVNIYLYILSSSNSLDNAKHKALGQQQRRAQLTADEHYWTRVIRRKYEISQEFYHMMKHMAVDCPHNLVLNTASFQDRSLTCFEYPYQKNLQDWVDSEATLYSPLEDMTDESRNNTHVRAIDLARVEQMVRLNV
jgi:superfamily II DNA or RNA helicase